MAKTETNNDPSEADIAAAQDVMRRAAEAQQRAAADRMKPVSDITNMPEFAAVSTAIDALPPELMGNMNVAPHIMALKAGINGFRAIAPAAAPAPAPAAPAA